MRMAAAVSLMRTTAATAAVELMRATAATAAEPTTVTAAGYTSCPGAGQSSPGKSVQLG